MCNDFYYYFIISLFDAALPGDQVTITYLPGKYVPGGRSVVLFNSLEEVADA